jgi:hypothetical protein
VQVVLERLAVPGEPVALHNHLLWCLPSLHVAVWPTNPVHKLTRSATAHLLSNNTHTHVGVRVSLMVWKWECVHARARKILVSVSILYLSLCLSRSSLLSFFSLFFSCLSRHMPSPAATAAYWHVCLFLAFSLTLFIFSLCMCILVYIYTSLSLSLFPPLSLSLCKWKHCQKSLR